MSLLVWGTTTKYSLLLLFYISPHCFPPQPLCRHFESATSFLYQSFKIKLCSRFKTNKWGKTQKNETSFLSDQLQSSDSRLYLDEQICHISWQKWDSNSVRATLKPRAPTHSFKNIYIYIDSREKKEGENDWLLLAHLLVLSTQWASTLNRIEPWPPDSWFDAQPLSHADQGRAYITLKIVLCYCFSFACFLALVCHENYSRFQPRLLFFCNC